MKHTLTFFARGVIYLVGLAALAVCIILLPELAREESIGKPTNPFMIYLFLGTSYVVATPFFIALYQAHKLLTYVDEAQAFSHKSITALQNIKICAIACSIMIILADVAGITFVRSLDPTEDVAPFVTLGFVFIFVASVVAVFIAVLQRLFSDAVALKSENDLIV